MGICYKCNTIFRYQWTKDDGCPACQYPTGLYFHGDGHYLSYILKYRPHENGYSFLHDTMILAQTVLGVAQREGEILSDVLRPR